MGFDPISLSAAAMIAGGIGTGVSAYSAIEQGQAQNRLAQYNAQVAQRDADATAAQGQIRANAVREQNAQILARSRAAYAADGVDVDTGSPLLVQAKQAGYLEQNALQVSQTADIESQNYQTQAGLDRAQGSAYASAGYMGGFGSLLKGVGTFGTEAATNRRLSGSMWG